MRLLVSMCLILAVIVVTITPASAEPRPDFGSWLKRVRDRIQESVDKYMPRILEVVGKYNSVRDSYGYFRDLFRGRRSADGLEYSVPAHVGAREHKFTAELDNLIESIVAEVIAAEIIGNDEEYDRSVEEYNRSVEENVVSKEDLVTKEDDVNTIGTTISYHPKALALK